MAFATGGKGGPQGDINVTPLVDVVLVLLIIFMVITPLMQTNLDADIPKPPETEQPPPDPNDPLQVVLQVKTEGVYINTDLVPLDQLGPRLETLMKSRKKEDRIAFVSGEPGLHFEKVIEVMDIARGAGVDSVGIIDPL